MFYADISSYVMQINIMHKKNDFAEVSKNLARYRSENNNEVLT